MKAILKHHEKLHNLTETMTLLADVDSDDDWSYRVGMVNMIQGWARIDVYDEDGELVAKGF